MPRKGTKGVMSLRITAGRRGELDVLRMAFARTGRRMTDADLIDFALSWAITSLPERLGKAGAARYVRQVTMSRAAGQAVDAAEPASVRVRDLEAIVSRRSTGRPRG
jgi:hypothetical protein